MSVYHHYFSPQYTTNYNNNLDDIIGPITTKTLNFIEKFEWADMFC